MGYQFVSTKEHKFKCLYFGIVKERGNGIVQTLAQSDKIRQQFGSIFQDLKDTYVI
jgi:hypothetical protein